MCSYARRVCFGEHRVCFVWLKEKDFSVALCLCMHVCVLGTQERETWSGPGTGWQDVWCSLAEECTQVFFMEGVIRFRSWRAGWLKDCKSKGTKQWCFSDTKETPGGRIPLVSKWGCTWRHTVNRLLLRTCNGRHQIGKRCHLGLALGSKDAGLGTIRESGSRMSPRSFTSVAYHLEDTDSTWDFFLIYKRHIHKWYADILELHWSVQPIIVALKKWAYGAGKTEMVSKDNLNISRAPLLLK